MRMKWPFDFQLKKKSKKNPKQNRTDWNSSKSLGILPSSFWLLSDFEDVTV